MADSVNRIVPPSVSVDRTLSPGREREGKNRSEGRRKAAEPKENGPVEDSETPEPNEEKNKGTKLDISA